MVGVEDASTHFTSVRGAMYGSGHPLRALSRKTQRIVTVWHRGPDDAPDKLLAPVYSVVTERIPEMIGPEDEFYQRFGHLAVKVKNL